MKPKLNQEDRLSGSLSGSANSLLDDENSDVISSNSILAKLSNCSGTGDNQAHARRKNYFRDSPK